MLCKDCVNYLLTDESALKTECDYEYFQGVELYKSFIFTAEDFDCEEWEAVEE